MFTKLDYLNFTANLIDHQQISFEISSPSSIVSANLLELNINVDNFNDCLYLLDGRFENLHTLQAKTVLKVLKSFSDNYLLPVNVAKTKAMLVYNAVGVSKPKIEYKGVPIEYVTNFKCLGVHIGTKLGWGKFIDDRLKKVRQSYCGLRKIFHTIPKNEIKLRRKLFLAFALPQFIWLFFCFFYFTDKQKEKVEHAFGTGIRLVYSLWGYDDLTTLVLSREFSLRDYLFKYWLRFQKHLHCKFF